MVLVKTRYGPSGEDASHGDSVDRADGIREGFDKKRVDLSLVPDDAPDWLQVAKDSYEDSTRFMESSLKILWEKNERAFQNRHAPGSKYLSEPYRARTKLFRPKTRATIRSAEAQVAHSFFANEDITNVRAQDQDDPQAVASAAVNQYLLQHRLTSTDPAEGIPWYLTVLGAFQDARKYGQVVSKQYWQYEEKIVTKRVPAIDPETKAEYLDENMRPVMVDQKEAVVIHDRPRCDLIPPENVRISRGADWRDPINSSPYLILLHPMLILDIEKRMQQGSGTDVPWKNVARTTLQQASSRLLWDSTRNLREGNREDSKDSQIAVEEFQTIWVHENFIRWDGVDWVYYTAGVHAMLSDPVHTNQVYRHCGDRERPVVMGYSLVETHKNYPAGIPELIAGLQQEANEIVNLRLDNVKLAMNHRWLVRRGKQVDLRSLMRGSPASITLVNDTEKDVKQIETRDVTSSAYAEQDRINLDLDDLAGNFSAGSIQSNRRMNETVGGMQLLAGGANLVSEYDLRTFTETWAEPTLRQLVRLEQTYEDDKVILALAGKKAQLFKRYGIDEVTDELLNRDMDVRVNVGLGATDPMQKLAKFQQAASIIKSIFGEQIVQSLNVEEILKEIFAPLGYRDGARFVNTQPDPMVQMLQQQLQKLQEDMDKRILDNETKIKVAQLQALGRATQASIVGEADEKREMLRIRAMLAKELLQGDEEGIKMVRSHAMAARERGDAEAQKGEEARATERVKGDNAVAMAMMQALTKPQGQAGNAGTS